ncbi:MULTISPECIES: chorismate mutase [Nocardiopsidaceae]|uniref:Chorismate mutase n=1 Tax=Streptomonospora nanhaiensis TaxID=1323731 RepID=A0ABY6YJ38_9ACTN|nr:chorismate mutase [Streptomonospora nanhaiensis]WAE71996.1 chorismate mutase [Streptomonospora nanhaiensis]
MNHPSATPEPAPAVPPTAPEEQIALLRGRIDRLDAELAALLERRALVAAQVQRLKPVGYFAGRDMGRERALVERMARHAPRLGPDRIAEIMDSVISAGLSAAEEEAGARRADSTRA